MINKRVFHKLLFLVIVSLVLNSRAQRKIYLSGEDSTTAIDWEFKVSEG